MRASTDQRKFRRFDVDKIHGSLQRARVLVVRNFSMTGLAVESIAPLSIGAVSRLKMSDGTFDLDVPAEVKWSQLVDVRSTADGVANNVYKAGLDISRALNEQAVEILNLIEGHVIVDIEGALRGHFRRRLTSAPRENAIPFSVKRISCSGMLIEASRHHLVPNNSVLEVRLDHEDLCFESVARVGEVRWSHSDLWLNFQDLSSDSRLALGAFIRRNLE